MKATVLNRILVVLGFIGVFVAGVLSVANVLEKDVPCGNSGGCATVAHDPSSHFFLGIPNAYIGLLGYLILAGLASYRELNNNPVQRSSVLLGFAAAGVGTLASLGLTFYAVSVIHATCLWCLTSAGVMTLTLITYAVLAQGLSAPVPPITTGARPQPMFGVVLVPILAVLSLGGVGVEAMQIKNGTGSAVTLPANQDMSELYAPGAHIKNPDGKVTVVEFGDLVCPVCKKLYPQVEKVVDDSNGKIRFVFHHFPLYGNPEHVAALPAAAISEVAAEKGLFWEYLAEVYGGSPEAPTPKTTDMLEMGKAIGLDPATLSKRLDSTDDPAVKRVTDDLNLAGKYGVIKTPTYFVIAPGLPTQIIAGGEVLNVLKEPQYAALLK